MLQEVPTPEVTPGHALVRVRAAGVCYRDIIDRGGGMPFMKRPVVLGHEFAGEVVEVGGGDSAFRVGDRVANLHRAPCGDCHYCRIGQAPRCERSLLMYGITIDGGYAEYVLAPLGSLVPLPAAIPYEQGCFLGCTAAVALRALSSRAQLRSGETVLVTGASGGVGMHAIHVAKALGARVIAVTSQGSKAAALTAQGADDVVVSPDLVFHKEVKRRTGGVDVVLECVGARTLNSAVRSLRAMGRVVVVGNITVERGEINPGLLILTELGVMGSSGFTRQDLEQVFRWVESGHLRPALAGTMPLAAAADAHRALEQRSVSGRLVLIP
jgi:acryloyl-coenzyme A reductase